MRIFAPPPTRRRQRLTDSHSPSGLEQAFLDNRTRLLAFLRARGAGDAAEDLLQDLWLRVAAARPGPVAAPLPYLYRAANMLMIDRYRSQRQGAQRDRAWSEAQGGAEPGVSDHPSVERVLSGRQLARLAEEELERLGPRPAAIFRRHRIDEVPQRQVAEEFGVSLSTVESDLRRAYRALADLKERIDEG